MSEHLLRLGAAAVLVSALFMNPDSASAQSPREELMARLDSLEAEYDRQHAIVVRLDSVAAAAAGQIRTDTTVVGPFRIVDPDTVDVSGVAEAVRDAWSERAAHVGIAAERIDGAVVTLTLGEELLSSEAGSRVHPFEPFVTGEADFPRAAERLVANVLTGALPADVKEWLGGATLEPQRRRDWTYRELATTVSQAGRQCFRGDVRACRTAVGLGESITDDDALSRGVRGGVLAHALEVGGADSYARLFDDAADVATRIENAAGRPIEEVIAGWRAAVQDDRPDIHAGIARAGFWTVVWLAGLALLAMRSTRWRLG